MNDDVDDKCYAAAVVWCASRQHPLWELTAKYHGTGRLMRGKGERLAKERGELWAHLRDLGYSYPTIARLHGAKSHAGVHEAVQRVKKGRA